MSNTQFAINRQMLANMMLNPARFLLGNHLLEISLDTPEIDGYNRKDKAHSGNVATNESANVPLDNLANDAQLRFKLRIIAPIVYTDFKHELLARQNDTTHEHETSFKAYANAEKISLGESEFLGEETNSGTVHKLIKLYVSQSKQVTKISQAWRKQKGAYQVKRNGEFIPYALPESENLAPIVTA